LTYNSDIYKNPSDGSAKRALPVDDFAIVSLTSTSETFAPLYHDQH
jgi:hypothetical protein